MILRLFALVSALTLAFSSTSKAQKKKAPKVPEGVEKISDIEYSNPDGSPLLLDLYLPKSKKAEGIPVIVFVHGGGWKNGSKQSAKTLEMAGQQHVHAEATEPTAKGVVQFELVKKLH